MLTDKPLPEERPTGIGVAAYNMAKALSKRGVFVNLICRGERKESVELDKNLNVKKLIHYSRENYLSFLSTLLGEGSDLVHIHSTSAVPSLIIARLLGKPGIFHIHGDPDLRSARLNLIRNIGMNLSRIAAVSKSMRDRLVMNHKINPHKIRVIYNGVDPELFKPFTPSQEVVSKYGLDEYDKIILSIGAVHERKGQVRMIDCLPDILKEWPDVIYVNIGKPYDEVYLAKLLQKARELGIPNSVKFLSGIPEDEKISIINASDLCVHPSVGEGFVLAVLEEMACAKTVFAYNVDSMPELINNGEDGFLFDPKDRRAWTDSIIDALADPGLTQKIGQAARAKVVSKFTWDKTAFELENFYKELIA